LVLDPCPVDVYPLPDEMPRRKVCASEQDEFCMDLDNAWLLDELIEALIETYRSAEAASRCQAEAEAAKEGS
jgi:hypothetical protein